ncbi:MAG: hypothetical protein M1827_002187 [Pycnora praestabilis]|nr:MAG: hypothetical protein M1827_002187 [Pycnora praestabilis]
MERQSSVQDAVSVKSDSPEGTASSAGTKRKRAPEIKFYSVRVGFNPGIYHSWQECLRQVKGFKKATFKSFTTRKDAESFLAGDNPSQNGTGAVQKYYAVQNGRVPGVYTDWPTAQDQITGWTKPKHRLFTNRSEAEAFVRQRSGNKASQGSEMGTGGNTNGVGSADTPSSSKDTAIHARKQKRTRTATDVHSDGRSKVANQSNEDVEPGTGPLPLDALDGFDPNIFLNPVTGQVEYKSDEQKAALKVKADRDYKGIPLRIYTDGSSLGNGAQGAVAGVGVYFGDGDSRNVSERLAGPRQSNNRAELTAIQRALDIAPRNRDVTIYTDSRYSIDCVTVWYINWRRNNWLTSLKKPVENKDLIENILSKIEERNALKAETKFEWLKGHADDPGNVAADHLAVDGAKAARELGD